MNRRQVSRLVDRVRQAAEADGRVAVLGLAYKPDTPVVDESPGLAVAEALASLGFSVSVYDPLANESARGRLGDRVTYHDDVDGCVDGAEVVVMATPWPEFAKISLEQLAARGTRVVFDCWHQLDPPGESPAEAAVEIVHIGVGRAVQQPLGDADRYATSEPEEPTR